MSLYDDADELFREVSRGQVVLKEEDMLRYLSEERFTPEEASGIMHCFQFSDSSVSLADFRKGYAGFIGKMSSLRKFVAAREKNDALLTRGFDPAAVEQFADEFLVSYVQTEALEMIDSLLQSYWQDRLEEKGFPHQAVIEVFMLIQGEIAEEYVRDIVEEEYKTLARDIELRITALLVDKGIKEQMTIDARDDLIEDVLHQYVHGWCSDYFHATTTLCKSARRKVARSNYITFRENALAMQRAQRAWVKELVDEVILEEASQIAEQVYRDEVRKEALEAAAETLDTLVEQSTNQVRLNAEATIPLVVADLYDHWYKFWRTWKTRTVEEAAQKVLDEMQEKEWMRLENEEKSQVESRLAFSEGKTEVEKQNWSEHLDSIPQVAQEKSRKPLLGGKEWIASELGRQWVHTFTEGQMADQGQDTSDRLQRSLASSAPASRADAVRTLAIGVRAGNPDLILLYSALASDPDKDVRRLALHALRMAMHAGHVQAEEALVLQLQAEERAVRVAALEMLRHRALEGSTPVITALVWQQNDPDKEVRHVVQGMVLACAVRGYAQGVYGLNLMLSDTKDTSSWLACHPQLRELCKNGNKKLTRWALGHVTNKSEAARKQAVQILGGCTEAMDAVWTAVFGAEDPGFAPVASTWDADPKRVLWDDVLSTLCRKCSEQGDKSEEVRRAALHALTVPLKHAHTATLQAVVQAARKDAAPKVRHQAATLLSVVPDSAAASVRSAILHGVMDQAAIVREVCVVALSGLCALPKVRKALLDAAVNDTSRYVRQEALSALHRTGHTDNIDLLRRLIWRLRDFGDEQNQDIIEIIADAVCVDEGRETVTRPPILPDEKEVERARAEAAKKEAEEEEKRKREETERLGLRMSSFADSDSEDAQDRVSAELYKSQFKIKIDPDDEEDDDATQNAFLPAKSMPADSIEERALRHARRRSSVAAGAVISMVLTSTRDRKPALRRAALKILALSQSGVGEAAFLHALQDSDRTVRLAGVEGIMSLLQSKYREVGLESEELVLEDQDEYDRALEQEGGWAAAREAALAKAAENKALEELGLSMLKVVHADSCDAVKAAALSALTSPALIRVGAVQTGLLGLLASSSDPLVRRAALLALADDDHLSLCVKGLEDDDPTVRAAAVHKAAVILDTHSTPTSSNLALDSSQKVSTASQRMQTQNLHLAGEKRPDPRKDQVSPSRPGTSATRPGTSASRPNTGIVFGDPGWSRLEVRAETADSVKTQTIGALHVLQKALADPDSEVQRIAKSALALRPDSVGSSG